MIDSFHKVYSMYVFILILIEGFRKYHLCFALNFMHGLPEDRKTTREGIAFVLNP